jgi:hypothetical protein
LQGVFVELAFSGLASLYPVSIGADLRRTIMDISAHAISLADRPQRAIRVTSVRYAPGRPILHLFVFLSQTSAGKGLGLHHACACNVFGDPALE